MVAQPHGLEGAAPVGVFDGVARSEEQTVAAFLAVLLDGTYLRGGPHSTLTERMQHDWIRSFQNPWIGRELSSLLAAAGVGDRRQEALWLSTQGFAESDLLFEISASARRLAAEFPEALPWLEAYRVSEAYGGVLMLTRWGRKC